ncbi:hypothetical protein [Furfurilactobacillus milii]|uniref:Glycosyl transferase 1 domain-containing protein n=1 Tax=Furfurilactobacillus milii TaxID=2888272 RepID=A0ABT6DC32_9LACO|nr:hypothetical protein [Furfurilactobacillus milii]QLE65598.1 hypothetical protein LROSL2_0245 [Furfurilactobacillus rossiae]MCF6161828.1 hypothetical protein [Furfurilactobacillus milii]MCF6164160.1 hypothetical protein [Furfurilactobacillus milii]MDF9914703.1 hypothetical protein [Furfurilactobacillus milii]QLE68028.1 hypothetical protein LROSL3_0246 [Furfurilactobacillus rossiae]
MKLFGHGKKVTDSAPTTAASEAPKEQTQATQTVIHSTATVEPSNVKETEQASVSVPVAKEDAYQKLTAKREQLEKHVNQLNQQYGDARNELRSQLLTEKDYLRTQSRAVNRDYDKLAQQRNADFEVFSQLQDQRNKVAAKQKQLAASLNETKQKFAEQSAILAKMKAQSAQIAKQRAQLDKQEHKLLGDLSQQGNLNSLMEEIDAKRKQISDINVRDHELEQAENGVNQEIVKQGKTVTALNKRVSAQEQANNQDDATADIQKQLAEIDKKVSLQQEKLTADDGKLRAVKQDKANLAEQFQQLTDLMKFYFSSTKLIDNFQFDPSHHYVFYSNTLIPLSQLSDQNGLEIIDHLFDKTDAHFDLLTTDFNRELSEIWADYLGSGILHHAGHVINPYLDFQRNADTQQHADVALPLDQSQDWQVNAGTEEQPEMIRSASGKQSVTLQYRADRSLESVKYFQNDKLFKMAIYDQQNVLLATQYVDPRDAKHAASEIYYRPDHSVALEKVFFEDHVVVQTTDAGKTVERTFETENDYYEWWMKSHALTRPNDSLIIDTDTPYFEQLLNDDDRRFELIPLITDVDNKALIEQIVAEDSPVNNIIVSDEAVHQVILKQLKRDMHIMVLDPAGVTNDKAKAATIKTRIYIPKVS